MAGTNIELLKIAKMSVGLDTTKVAFIPNGDPAMSGGMDPAAAGGGDPSAMGGAPGMDPSMMGGAPGMDPSAMGGAPAAPPPAPAPAPAPAVATQAAEPIKPKIDVNVTLLQILKILARIADALHIPVPASEMVATQNDLTSFGAQQSTASVPAGGDPAAAGGGAIPPVAPLQGAGGKTAGDSDLATAAAAIRRMRARG